MAENTKVNGSTIIWMAWVFTHGLMDVAMTVSTKMIKSMDMVFTHGEMADNIRAGGSKGNNMVSVYTLFLI